MQQKKIVGGIGKYDYKSNRSQWKATATEKENIKKCYFGFSLNKFKCKALKCFYLFM